jgi:hypothetical protein
VLGLFLFTSAPLFAQRYPRDVVLEVLARYRPDAVAYDTSLQHTVDATSGFIFPAVMPVPGKRYVLVNARDLWFEGEPGVKPVAEGRVIASWRHPRQLRFMQYHGHTPAERRFMRSTDASMRLIDRGTGQPATIEHH